MTTDKVLRLCFKTVTGGMAAFVTHRMMNDKVNDLTENGNVVNAFVVGGGQMAISLAVGGIVATVLG